MIFKIFKDIVSHEIGRTCSTNEGKGNACRILVEKLKGTRHGYV
jgi:hypothetical protein